MVDCISSITHTLSYKYLFSLRSEHRTQNGGHHRHPKEDPRSIGTPGGSARMLRSSVIERRVDTPIPQHRKGERGRVADIRRDVPLSEPPPVRPRVDVDLGLPGPVGETDGRLARPGGGVGGVLRFEEQAEPGPSGAVVLLGLVG